MKKSMLAAVAASTGAVIFAAAAVANYTTANGYELIRNSLFGLRGTENYTMDMEFSIDTGDGYGTELLCRIEMDEPNQRSYAIDRQRFNIPGSTTEREYRSWAADGMRIYMDNSDEKAYGYKADFGVDNPFTADSFGDEKTTAKVMKFLELGLDTFVGDLKNNFTYAGEDGGLKTYTLSLDAIQVPELVNAGLSAVTSLMSAEYEDVSDPDELERWTASFLTADEVYTSSVNGSFVLNEDNSFSSGEMSAVVTGTDANGERLDVTIGMKLSMTDVGTTVPEAPPENYSTPYDEKVEEEVE